MASREIRADASAPFPFDAHALAHAAAWLRPCAALGQVLAIGVAIAWLHIALPLRPLFAGIAILALATPLAFWRLRGARPVGEAEAVGHVAFDLLLLGWALFFTGGATNPFITLLLVPVALGATALSVVGTGVVVALAAALYAVLFFFYVPLPDMSVHAGNGFGLHLTGMAINFGVAIVLLTVFIGRLTATLRAQRETARRLRERLLRDEGILAIATQAAEAAHRLNTPLATLRVGLPELAAEREDDAGLHGDVDLMVREVERCRGILHDMVDYGRLQLAGTECTVELGDYVRDNAERFRLLRPEAEVRVRIAPEVAGRAVTVQPALAHALLNLMQNALDASTQAGLRIVTLDAAVHGDRVEFVIGDHGDGPPAGALAGMPLASDKPNGLGMGLALARSTIERLRGELHALHDAGGTHVHVRIPLSGGIHP